MSHKFQEQKKLNVFVGQRGEHPGWKGGRTLNIYGVMVGICQLEKFRSSAESAEGRGPRSVNARGGQGDGTCATRTPGWVACLQHKGGKEARSLRLLLLLLPFSDATDC